MVLTRRRAFSLIELLVALAIFDILAALLLSAVQRVRLVAARIACANNVKQLALALHTHHDTMGAFPAGCRSRTQPLPYLSWRAAILPQIEQQALADAAAAAYRADANPFGAAHTAVRVQTLKIFACPVDERLTTAWEMRTLNGRRVRTALSSYLGVSGTTSRARDGVLYADSRTQLVHITDGTSNTLLLGERPPSADLVYGWWYVGSGQGTGRVDSHLGAAELNALGARYRGCPSGPYLFQDDTVRAPCATFHYWSLHPGGTHFATADGAVRFVTYEAASILPRLATRSGGEVAVID